MVVTRLSQCPIYCSAILLPDSQPHDSPEPTYLVPARRDSRMLSLGRLPPMHQTFLERSMAPSPRDASRVTVADRISTTFAVVANAAQSFMSARRFSSF
jgi:hypothetical protein